MKVDLKTVAYNYLKMAIINGDLPENSPIRETEISKSLEMSRSPIREAIRALEIEGVVVSYPSRGAYVASLNPKDVHEICELRSLFEIWALERAYQHFTFQELSEFEEKFTSAYFKFDWEAYHKTDQEFHRMIISKANCARLAGFYDTLNLQCERLRRYCIMSPKRMQESYEEHLILLQSIRTSNLPLAKEQLKSHLTGVAEAIVKTCITLQSNGL